MKALRLLFLVAFVLSAMLAVTILMAPLAVGQAPAPAQGAGAAPAAPGGGAGRGGPPPQAMALSPEVANEDPQTETMRNDRMDFPPFKIIGNLYYVGTAFCASYLINTPMGNILINTNYEETFPFLVKNIEKLGFKVSDTKILLASHAHPDHQTGDANFKLATGATTEFMAEDVPAIQNIKPEGKEHPIDKVLHDGDTVSLGGTTLTAHLNPGHTLGCTTWTLPMRDGGKNYNVTIICGGLQDNARLVYNQAQPDIATVWQKTIDTWKTYPTDVFLGAHTWFFNLTGKYKKMQANPKGPNVWIDPAGYKKYIADTQELKDKLVTEQTAAGPPAPRGGRGGAPGAAPAGGQRGGAQ